MRSRWPIVALLCVLASLLVPSIASAHATSGAESRAWDFSTQENVCVGGAAALTLELHLGYELSYDDWTSDSPLAAKGGWKLGDDIYTPTKNGAPSWKTVRNRYWKNEAGKPGAVDKWGADNVARMKKGNAPQRYNADKGGMESMELSHEPIPARDGGRAVVPRWPQDHAAVDPFRHPGY